MSGADPVGLFRRSLPPLPAGAGAVSLPSLVGAADAFLALALAENGPRVVLAVTPGLPEADRLGEDLRLLCDLRLSDCLIGAESHGADKDPVRLNQTIKQSDNQTIRILSFPPRLEGDKSALGLRLKTLAALKAWPLAPYPAVVVAPFAALADDLPQTAPEPLTLQADGSGVGFAALCDWLAKTGYARTPAVEREGDYAVRGGIVDAWSPGEDAPLRAEFFGDALESLRLFDPATQVSIGPVRQVSLMPCAEETGSTGLEKDLQDSAQAGAHNPVNPTGNPVHSVFSLLPPGSVLLALEHNDYNLSNLSNPSNLLVYTGDPPPPSVASLPFHTSPLPGFAELGADEAHHPELFDAARARLERHLAAAERRGDLVARLDDLSGGFEIPGLVVVTKADRVFTKRRVARRVAPQGARGERLRDFEELEPGEYVVHLDHGVGRFVGSSEVQLDGRRSEVFTLEYADGALLHVPAAHAHLLSRYVGVKGEQVKLHRLDGKRWEKDKANARKAVADLASALLETQARRQVAPGFAYDVRCDGLAAFEAAFPYEETPDQAAAIAAVKADMAEAKPMDRLICGDAGYGKTEVAMRAAFIAAMNGRQVAVLAPTTVLAEQHFETFTSRFDGTPVRIEATSRFQSPAVREGTFKRLATGVCDIVIGTHALLSGKVSFRDLGLIIIDEEQRFGVRHKEFLKRLRATADVLTLSATPIPRTLYLSMTGARDLSLLRSPPRERVAVETRVVRDSDAAVRAAIDAELARGGQVYFLHNRVATIGRVEKRLKALCPKARLTVAHGQMDSDSLARKIRDFEQGRTDVLLSTTIVESGIDIPRANTILIDRADTFGLADLYQLRGRVGRSSRQGHAILLLPPSGDADSDARERLKALQRHGGLGAGFGLALRDLELRGAGNLLGSQQSGHIAAVGFTLYCQLLQRTIALLKGEKVRDVVDVRLNLDFLELSPAAPDADNAAALPYSYIEEDVQRMSLLRRFAEAMDARTVRALADEMEDRFGRMPAAARRFVRLAAFRVRCAAARIDRIDAKGDRAVFYRVGSNAIAYVADLSGRTPDARLTSLEKALRPAD